jgi:uncharacterized membrane-anchored protein
MMSRSVREALTNGMVDWHQAKLFVEHFSNIDHDAIHVMAGVALQLLIALLARRSVASWLPWLAVLALAVANEAVDQWIELWPDRGMQQGEAGKDILLTIALPTVLLIVARARPQLFARSGRR